MARNGEEQALRPKVMEVLLCLAEAPGAVVSKEDLRSRVWHGDEISDEVLRRTIFDLRQSFADDPKSPAYVETIPRRGYRLIASVQPLELELEAPQKLRRFWGRGLLLLTGVFVLAAAAWLKPERAPAPEPESPAEPVLHPLPALPGIHRHPVLSPDGRVAAFASHTGESDTELFLMDLSTQSSMALTDTPWDEEFPTFSPDGDRLAFLRRQDGFDEVWTLEVAGLRPGAAKQLVRLPGQSHGLRWSPSGEWLVLGRKPPAARVTSLSLISLATGDEIPLTQPPPGIKGDTEPAWSPDGDQLAFLRHPSSESSTLMTLAIDRPENLFTVIEAQTPIGDPFWSTDGTHLYFLRAEPGINHLWKIPAQGGQQVPVTKLVPQPSWTRPSSQRDQLIFADVATNADLWVLDLQDASATPRRVAPTPATEYSPALSADGQRLAFVSEVTGYPEIWTSTLDGKEATQHTWMEGPFIENLRWSPTGEALAFEAQEREDSAIGILKLGEEPHILSPHPAVDRRPSFTADGQAVLFSSNRGGEWQVWKYSLQDDEAVALPGLSGMSSLDRGRDGLFFSDDNSLYRWRPGARPEWVTEASHKALDLKWAIVGQFFYYSEPEGRKIRLRRRDLVSGEVSELATAPNYLFDPGLSVSGDGRFLVWNSIGQFASELRLIRGLENS